MLQPRPHDPRIHVEIAERAKAQPRKNRLRAAGASDAEQSFGHAHQISEHLYAGARHLRVSCPIDRMNARDLTLRSKEMQRANRRESYDLSIAPQSKAA